MLWLSVPYHVVMRKEDGTWTGRHLSIYELLPCSVIRQQLVKNLNDWEPREPGSSYEPLVPYLFVAPQEEDKT